MIGRASWVLLQTQLVHWVSPDWAWAMEQEQTEYDYDDENSNNNNNNKNSVPGNIDSLKKIQIKLNIFKFPSASPAPSETMDVSINLPDDTPTMDNAYANKTRPQPCDTYTDLYTLQPEKLFKGGKPDSVKGKHNCNANVLGSRPCERHYSTHKIPHSNLLLLVIDTTCKCETQKRKIETEKVRLNDSESCDRPQESLFRSRPSVCISYHPEVNKYIYPFLRNEF